MWTTKLLLKLKRKANCKITLNKKAGFRKSFFTNYWTWTGLRIDLCSEQKNKNGQTMLGIIYLFIMFLVGNLICRRFYDFMSLPHRLAGTFLVGFLVSTWATYLFALIFFWTQNPLLWGNLLFFVSTIIFFFLFYRRNQFEFSKKSFF